MRINEATSVQPIVAGIFAVGSGRLGASVAAVVGLTGAVIGGRALAGSRGRDRSDADVAAANGRREATVAIVLGMFGLVLGALFAVTADGGLGTGNGFGGAIVGMVLGLTATVLGGLARARRRRSRETSRSLAA